MGMYNGAVECGLDGFVHVLFSLWSSLGAAGASSSVVSLLSYMLNYK